MAHYELVYGRRCTSPIRWFEVKEVGFDKTKFSSPSYVEGEGEYRMVDNEIESSKILH